MKLDVQTCKFVPVTDVVPEKWRPWFFEGFVDGADFSWGDNNRTMITKDRFAEHAEDFLFSMYDDEKEQRKVTEDEIGEWLNKVRAIPADVYIDLEN